MLSRPSRPRRIPVVTVTGSESTGKTTLAQDLAEHFGTVWVPEYAREHAAAQRALGRTLDPSDVDPIARGQMAVEDSGLATANGLLVLDTDLVSTVVYARHYYGDCPAWVEQAARERRADLYLLCDIDVPWVADPARDLPHLREHMHPLFTAALDALGGRHVTIRGPWRERLASAIAATRSVIPTGAP